MFKVTEDLYASSGKRFLNSIIDGVVIFFIAIGIEYVLFYINDIFEVESLYYYYLEMSVFEEYALGYVINFLFFFTMEITTSKTIGKFATNTIVVMNDGEKPSPKVIAIRSLCRLIPFEMFSYLGTPCRGWHDSISKTYVVEKQRLENKKGNIEALDQIGVSSNE